MKCQNPKHSVSCVTTSAERSKVCDVISDSDDEHVMMGRTIAPSCQESDDENFFQSNNEDNGILLPNNKDNYQRC